MAIYRPVREFFDDSLKEKTHVDSLAELCKLIDASPDDVEMAFYALDDRAGWNAPDYLVCVRGHAIGHITEKVF